MEAVAFHAYLSTDVPAYSAAHYIIVFDKVVTNVGNGYHSHLGTFIAPRSGLYVFTWTIRQWGSQRHHITELVIDNEVAHVIYMHPDNGVDSSVTGTVVVQVNQRNDVLVRTGSRYNNGEINSDIDGRSTFSGWNIM